MKRSRIRMFLWASITAIYLFPISINAQTDSTDHSYWFNIGARYSELDNAGWHISYNSSLYRRYCIQFIGMEQTYPQKRQLIFSTGFGIQKMERFYLLAAFIGPSLNITKKYSADPYKYIYAGLNFNEQLFFKPLPEIGLGIDLIQNVNSFKSFFAIQFALSINNNCGGN